MCHDARFAILIPEPTPWNQETIVMEPTFIRPVMTSYLANRARRTPRPADPDADHPARPSQATLARQSAGRLLIALGHRLVGTPRVTVPDPR
jgi:hypothetical protein